MKRYEYKKLQSKPFMQMLNPADYEKWMLETLNKWGAEGWRAVNVTTPVVNNQLTGDLIVLGIREMPPMGLPPLDIMEQQVGNRDMEDMGIHPAGGY